MVNDLDITFAALGDANRRRVVELLRERPRRAGELAAACHTSGPAMSRHLRLLRASGLVEISEQKVGEDARVHLYLLRRESLDNLLAWLNQVQSPWEEEPGTRRTGAQSRRGITRR